MTETGIERVRSADGSEIAFARSGRGPAVILIGGAFNDRSTTTALADGLAEEFTTYRYDRRGRGDSEDRASKVAVAREVEDIAALIEHAGGEAALFGHSSGAVLALEATAAGLAVSAVVAYEPPYSVGPVADERVASAERVVELAEAGDSDGAAAEFLRMTGAPAEVVDGMRADANTWAYLTAQAHTLPYDIAVCGSGLPADRLGTIGVPVLVIDGGDSEEALRAGARAAADAVPGARYRTLPGEDHGILRDPAALVPVVAGFLGRARL
ncbi:alpha/beta hydrolase [Amycolatopsis minnesotensis]|uniref:Alpha/beta hydrolase n=1 Tax=Amycolatopsis minnesotensis TaxID=337894 RepID=A0ABN2RJ50_9PSEU